MMPYLEVLFKFDSVFVDELELIFERKVKSVYALSSVLPSMVVAWVLHEDFDREVISPL